MYNVPVKQSKKMQSEDIQNILLLARWRFDEYLETLKPALRKISMWVQRTEVQEYVRDIVDT